MAIKAGRKLQAKRANNVDLNSDPTTTLDEINWIALYEDDPKCESFGFGFRQEDDQLVLLDQGKVKPVSVLTALKWWEAIESSPIDPGGCTSNCMFAMGKFLKLVIAAMSDTVEIDVTPEMRMAAGGDVGAWCQDWIDHAVETDLKEVGQ